MTIDRWSLVRFVHVIAAMGWVGGQLLLSGVILPALRSATDVGPEQRAALARTAGHRFAVISTAALLPTLVVTGVAMAMHRGVSFETLTRGGYGRLLAIKLVLVVASVTLATVHGILVRHHPTPARIAAASGLASSVGVVVFATALVP